MPVAAGVAKNETCFSPSSDGVACELLEQGQMSLENIAARSGFGNLPTMRHHFRKCLNTSPSSYRKVFVGASLSTVD